MHKLWIYLLRLLRYDFFNSKLWLPVWTGSKGQIGVNFFVNIFLKINDLYNSAQIVNLPLAVVEIWFFVIVNFDFRFGQEVKVKLGHFFVNIFSQLTICTMVQKLSIYLLRLLRYDFFNFDFRFRQEVKVKLGSLFYQYFLTNNDLYNGAKIVNLPLVVVEIWFF